MDLDINALLQKRTIRVLPLYIKEWEGTVYIKDISAKTGYSQNGTELSKEEYQKDLVIKSLCDKDGQELLNEDTFEQLMEQNNMHVINRIYQKITELNEYKQEEVEDLKKTSIEEQS